MHFINFIKTLPKQENPSLNKFIQWAVKEKKFPASSDPQLLADYLFDKLDWDLTHAYQQIFFLYHHTTPNNTIPAQYKGQKAFMDGMNFIVDLKNQHGHNPSIQMKTVSKKQQNKTAHQPEEHHFMEIPDFKDLIQKLQSVRSPGDINQELIGELLGCTIGALVFDIQKEEIIDELEAITIARDEVLSCFDTLLFDARLAEELEDE